MLACCHDFIRGGAVVVRGRYGARYGLTPRSWFSVLVKPQVPDLWTQDPWDCSLDSGILVVEKGNNTGTPRGGGVILACINYLSPSRTQWVVLLDR